MLRADISSWCCLGIADLCEQRSSWRILFVKEQTDLVETFTWIVLLPSWSLIQPRTVPAGSASSRSFVLLFFLACYPRPNLSRAQTKSLWSTDQKNCRWSCARTMRGLCSPLRKNGTSTTSPAAIARIGVPTCLTRWRLTSFWKQLIIKTNTEINRPNCPANCQNPWKGFRTGARKSTA